MALLFQPSLPNFRRLRPGLSASPIQRVKESEFPYPGKKVWFMDAPDTRPRSNIPIAASSWGKNTLDLLNAKFVVRDTTAFDIADLFGLQVPLQLPDEVQARICPPLLTALMVVNEATATALEKVKNSDEISNDFRFRVSEHPDVA